MLALSGTGMTSNLVRTPNTASPSGEDQSRASVVRYADPSYWDHRYALEADPFEWFLGGSALRHVVRKYIPRAKPCLQVGCGTSNLQEMMAAAGYTVVNLDISPVVVQQMSAKHAHLKRLSYIVGDCRAMTQLGDCTFGSVLEKGYLAGTLDALLCSKSANENVVGMMSEMYRVLRPGGVLLLVSLGPPPKRVPLLMLPGLDWDLSVLLLPKLSQDQQLTVEGKHVNDSRDPVAHLGPFKVDAAGNLLDAPEYEPFNYFYAYIARKRPLRMPLSRGEHSEVPQGWVKQAREVAARLGLPADVLDRKRQRRVLRVPSTASPSNLSPSVSAPSLTALHAIQPDAESLEPCAQPRTELVVNGSLQDSVQIDGHAPGQGLGSCHVLVGVEEGDGKARPVSTSAGGYSASQATACGAVECTASVGERIAPCHAQSPAVLLRSLTADSTVQGQLAEGQHACSHEVVQTGQGQTPPDTELLLDTHAAEGALYSSPPSCCSSVLVSADHSCEQISEELHSGSASVGGGSHTSEVDTESSSAAMGLHAAFAQSVERMPPEWRATAHTCQASGAASQVACSLAKPPRLPSCTTARAGHAPSGEAASAAHAHTLPHLAPLPEDAAACQQPLTAAPVLLASRLWSSRPSRGDTRQLHAFDEMAVTAGHLCALSSSCSSASFGGDLFAVEFEAPVQWVPEGNGRGRSPLAGGTASNALAAPAGDDVAVVGDDSSGATSEDAECLQGACDDSGQACHQAHQEHTRACPLPSDHHGASDQGMSFRGEGEQAGVTSTDNADAALSLPALPHACALSGSCAMAPGSHALYDGVHGGARQAVGPSPDTAQGSVAWQVTASAGQAGSNVMSGYCSGSEGAGATTPTLLPEGCGAKSTLSSPPDSIVSHMSQLAL